MKALSLWQPWASAMACGSKRIETRSWATSYRGPVAIHAAKRCIKAELIDVQRSWEWCAVLYDAGVRMGARQPVWDVLPFGAIVAVAQLIECRRTETFTGAELDVVRVPGEDLLSAYRYTERKLGNFSHGRYGWVFAEVQRLERPVPCRGYQQLFDVELSPQA